MNYERIIAQNQAEIAQKDAIILDLKHQLDQLKKYIFGRKSERFVSSDIEGPNLFSGLEEPLNAIEGSQAQAVEETITYTRKKATNQKGRQLLKDIPSGMLVQETILEPNDKPENVVELGKEVSLKLGYIPGKFFIKQLTRKKYIDKEAGTIHIAPMPTEAIERCEADTSLLSHIAVSKFVDHLPEYRQLQIYKRDGMEIPASTINGWTHSIANYITPLVEEIKKQILSSGYIQMDESTIKVLKSKSQNIGYMWVMCDPKTKMSYFDFHHGRGGIIPIELLKTYNGNLQTDGYDAYQKLSAIYSSINHSACMAHARRKFDEAKSNDEQRSKWMMQKMQKLYTVEQHCRDKGFTADQRLTERQEESIPILNEMKTWLDHELLKVTPRSPIGQAIGYTLNLWSLLIKYAYDGKLEIDNNLVENAIRPLALGRKNYLFAGSPDAAINIGKFYTIFSSCKALEINPYDYMKWVLDTLPNHSINEISLFTPWAYKNKVQILEHIDLM